MDGEHRNEVQIKKKVRPTSRPSNTALFILRAVQLGLSVVDMDALTMGMIVDMQTEAANDHEEYAYKATKDDFMRF